VSRLERGAPSGILDVVPDLAACGGNVGCDFDLV